MAKNFYDLEAILSIPIKDVCDAFGIKIGRGGMCRIRPDDRSPSCKIYTNSSDGYDSFYDFGCHVGGSVIDLVMFLTESDRQGAFDWLGQTFNIPPQNNTDYEIRNELTNGQYACIGIQGDLATKNLDFDLEKYSMESAQKYSDKYHMSVNELRKQYPNFYTHKILMNKALPFVLEMQNNYYMRLYNHYILARAMGMSDLMHISGTTRQEFEELKNELSRADKLLYKAAKGTSLEERLSPRKYDVQQDYEAVINGKIVFQIGPVSYFTIKQQARLNDDVVHYRSVSTEDFPRFENLAADIPFAAFVKGTQVNLCFLPDMSEAIEQCLAALQVRDGNTKKNIQTVAPIEKNNNGRERKTAVYENER